jgi:hypothetical protein
MICPSTGVYAAFNALGGPRQMVMDPLAGHTHKPDWYGQAWDFFLAHGKD